MSVISRKSRGFVEAHAATCERCASSDEGAHIRRVAGHLESLLDANAELPGGAHVRRLSSAVLSAAAPLLALQVRRLYWRRVAGALAIVVAPLPLVYVCGAWVLGRAYAVLSTVASEPVAVWAVASYASLVALAIALGCAVIPLLVERTVPAWATAPAAPPQAPRRSIA